MKTFEEIKNKKDKRRAEEYASKMEEYKKLPDESIRMKYIEIKSSVARNKITLPAYLAGGIVFLFFFFSLVFIVDSFTDMMIPTSVIVFILAFFFIGTLFIMYSACNLYYERYKEYEILKSILSDREKKSTPKKKAANKQPKKK